MIDLLIKYPTRSRPETFKRILLEYITKLSGKNKIKFIISMDNDDNTCNNEEMRSYLDQIKKTVDLVYHYGDSKNKVDACNRDIPPQGWKVCILVSDDMTPRVAGYDQIILNDMNKYYPDLDGALNYNCGGEAYPVVMVLSIIGHKYYDRYGYIYNSEYTSLFCDEEQTVVARSLNKITDIDNKIITHDWSDIQDDLRRHTEKYYNSDKLIFESRKKRGFPNTKYLWTIGILHLPKRAATYNKLIAELQKQITEAKAIDRIQIITDTDEGNKTVGAKRNNVVNLAEGQYISFIDDDDMVTPIYVSSVLKALKSEPDVVELVGYIPHYDLPFIHNLNCGGHFKKDGIQYRTPNHLNTIKTRIAKQVPYKEISHGEDQDYSVRLWSSGLMKSEQLIGERMYVYQFDPVKSETVKFMKKD